MKKIIKLTEQDLNRIVRRVIKEQATDDEISKLREKIKQLYNKVVQEIEGIKIDDFKNDFKKNGYFGNKSETVLELQKTYNELISKVDKNDILFGRKKIEEDGLLKLDTFGVIEDIISPPPPFFLDKL